MRSPRPRLTAPLLLLLLLAAACNGDRPSGTREPSPTGSPAPDVAPTTAETAGESTPTPTQEATETEGTMPIRIIVEGSELRGTLDDTPAGRDFAALLPLTLRLTDFHGEEKISNLPRRLSNEDQVRPGTPGLPGDLTVYVPWGNLAIFYRDFTYSDELFRLGRLEPGAAEVIAELADGTTVTIDTIA